jgi:hypothetical protein
MPDLFASSSMGAGYANSRLPIHPLVIERVLAQLGAWRRFSCALDVGCGEFDPAEAMLK